MVSTILSIMTLVFGILAIFISRSKAHYDRLVLNGGEDFALKINKKTKIGGYFLLIFSTMWLLFNLLAK
jgi:hypothetical protein